MHSSTIPCIYSIFSTKRILSFVVCGIALGVSPAGIESSYALTAADFLAQEADFTCAEMGLNPNQGYPVVHGGGCIGEAPYSGVNLPGRTNCRVDQQYSCSTASGTVCVRIINCNDGKMHDTSCDAEYITAY